MKPKKTNKTLVGQIVSVNLAALLILCSTLQAGDQPIIWTPKEIQETIALGKQLDLTVTFTSNVNLSNANLWVVPELQPFVAVDPDLFSTLIANTPQQVTLHIFAPPNSQLGAYDGTVHLRVGSKTYPQTLKVKLQIISVDHPMVTVPNVVGKTQAEAQSALIAANLTLGTVTSKYDDTNPPGNVVSQNPAAGTSVLQGSSVHLVISQQVPVGATTGWIGPTGGTLTDPGGASLSIPPGALSESTLISISTHRDIHSLPAPAPFMGGVNLGPNGLTFTQPATLTIPLYEKLPAGTKVPLFMYDSNRRAWSLTTFVLEVNADEASATGDITHFTDIISLGQTLSDLFFPIFENRFFDVCNPAPVADLYADLKNRITTLFPLGDKKLNDYSTTAFPNRVYACYQVTGIDLILQTSRSSPLPDGEWYTDDEYFSDRLGSQGAIGLVFFDFGDRMIVNPQCGGEYQLVFMFDLIVYLQCANPDLSLRPNANTLIQGESTPVKASLTCGGEGFKNQNIDFPQATLGALSASQVYTDEQGIGWVDFTANPSAQGDATIRGQYEACFGQETASALQATTTISVNPRVDLLDMQAFPPKPPINYPIQLTAVPRDAGGNEITTIDGSLIHWSSNKDPSVASFSPQQGLSTTLTVAELGWIKVTATYSDGAQQKTGYVNICVHNRVADFEIVSSTQTLYVGDSVDLSAAVVYGGNGQSVGCFTPIFSWESLPLGNSVATVSPPDGEGTRVTANAAGDAVIRATLGSAYREIPIHVECNAVIDVTPQNGSNVFTSAVRLTGTVSGCGQNGVTGLVVTVQDAQGQSHIYPPVSVGPVGTFGVTIGLDWGVNRLTFATYNGSQIVHNNMQGVDFTLHRVPHCLKDGQTLSLPAATTTGNPLFWMSSNPAIVSVDPTGHILTANADGWAWIYATIGDLTIWRAVGVSSLSDWVPVYPGGPFYQDPPPPPAVLPQSVGAGLIATDLNHRYWTGYITEATIQCDPIWFSHIFSKGATYLYDGTSLQIITVPGTYTGIVPWDVNELGQVVGDIYTDLGCTPWPPGSCTTSDQVKGFIYSDGSMSIIEYPGAFNTWLHKISNSGIVTGHAQVMREKHGVGDDGPWCVLEVDWSSCFIVGGGYGFTPVPWEVCNAFPAGEILCSPAGQ